jgi:CRP-like cAMP-binding protein
MAAFDELAERLEQSYQALEQLTVGSADRRVAAVLLSLSEKLGRVNEGRIELSVPLSRADLGAIARITPESASRALGRLRAAGAVDFGRQWTAIVDPGLLHEIATS